MAPQNMRPQNLRPRTGNIIESCLYVADVGRAAEWYGEIFGFPLIFQEGDRLRALQVGEEQVLLLFKERGSLTPAILPGGIIPAHDASGPAHIAFSMRTAEAEQWEKHLSAHHVQIESVVNWGEGDKSFYFRDPDNHVLELISHGHWQKVAAG
jgi:catechol 2,3-dioxygenase-like lactoylglutathione lyase family enzyme